MVDKLFTADTFQMAQVVHKTGDKGPFLKNGTFIYLTGSESRVFYIVWIKFNLPLHNVITGYVTVQHSYGSDLFSLIELYFILMDEICVHKRS